MEISSPKERALSVNIVAEFNLKMLFFFGRDWNRRWCHAPSIVKGSLRNDNISLSLFHSFAAKSSMTGFQSQDEEKRRLSS
jgi:hypothetical protein